MTGISNRLVRHWLLLVNLLWVVYTGLPWLAPVFMRAGADRAGRAIYALYAVVCHQMAQRSLFLFGRQRMYTLSELQATWPHAHDMAGLRAVVGNAEMGWKVAWSDRMVAMFAAVVAFGLLFALVRRRLHTLPIWLAALLLLPMALDGGTHFLSDLEGLGQGFRATNSWLGEATGNRLPATFTSGDGLGSFNSWMRLATGVLFGLALVWFLYPHMESAAQTIGAGTMQGEKGDGEWHDR